MTTRAQRALEDLEVPEGFRAELINGEIILSPSSKPLHWRIQRSLIHQFARLEWEAATDQTIVHPDHGDQPQPDFIALSELEIDPEDFYPADQVLFVAEVLSKSNKGTDLVDKVEVYARFGIPMYLIIDPFKGECLLHTSPHGETYETRRITVFGEAIELPQPIGMVLGTDSFRTYKRA